ncbi:hypothetical protein BD413DRAFT_97003 [Trametes elegans]|nr:hypothetical protein BD413DRAFT_97003 [Trametes elegans]
MHHVARKHLTRSATQETLFSVLHLDPKRQHVLSVINLQDDRFNHTSQITFDSVVVSTGTDSDGANSTPSSSESAVIIHGLPTGISTIADVPPATSTSTQASVTTAIDGSTFTVISTSAANGSQALGSTGAPTISTSTAQPGNTDITTSEGQTATARSSTLTGTASSGAAHVNDPPALPSLTSESEAGSAAPTSTSTGESSTSVPSAPSGGNTNGVPLPSATSQRDDGHSGTPQPSASPTSPAPTGSATGTTSAADRSRNTGISKPAIIGIAVVASLLVFALLVAVLVMLVRNRRARQNADMEGTAGLMREAAPTAVGASAPLSLIPPRPRNPFADTVPPDTPLDAPDPSTESLDAVLRQPQPSGAPSRTSATSRRLRRRTNAIRRASACSPPDSAEEPLEGEFWRELAVAHADTARSVPDFAFLTLGLGRTPACRCLMYLPSTHMDRFLGFLFTEPHTRRPREPRKSDTQTTRQFPKCG